MPTQLLATYPVGTQQRSLADLQSVFESKAPAIKREFELRVRQPIAGKLVFSVVLNGAGDVEFVQLTAATTEHLVLRKPIESMIRSLQFGPAAGAGYFVFSYPIVFLPH